MLEDVSEYERGLGVDISKDTYSPYCGSHGEN